MASISELVASGEAWASDLADVHALRTPAAERLTAPEEPSARSSPEVTLAGLLPSPEPRAEPHAPPAPARVQLGFRDGSSASLDPDSEQALALELLAQSLTRRD